MEKVNFEFSLSDEQKKLKDKTYQKLMEDPHTISFMEKNKVDREFIYHHCGKIQDWIEQCETCERCKGLSFCSMSIQGHFMDLQVEDAFLNNEIKKCTYQESLDEAIAHKKNYLQCDMKKEFLNIVIKDIDLTNESKDYQSIIVKCLKLIHEPTKGLYLYGQPGVGKTYLMAGVTNELAKKNRKIAFVNVPKYIADLKMLFKDGNEFDRKLRFVKNVEVLVLDDIGGESVTAWSRDEILLPLLDERMNKNKVTLFTSNYSMEELLERLTVTNNAMKEPMAAKRLLDRIKSLSTEVFVKGNSRRK